MQKRIMLVSLIAFVLALGCGSSDGATDAAIVGTWSLVTRTDSECTETPEERGATVILTIESDGLAIWTERNLSTLLEQASAGTWIKADSEYTLTITTGDTAYLQGSLATNGAGDRLTFTADDDGMGGNIVFAFSRS